MKRTNWTRRLTLVAVLGLAAACGDDDPVDPGQDPTYDPVETADQVSEVLDPLLAREDALLAVEAAATALTQFSGSAAMLDLGPGVILHDPTAPERLRSADGLRLSPDGLRQVTRSFPVARLVLPAEVSGETLVWDPEEDRYVVDAERDDAPANGVRVVYYAMNPATRVPVEPLNELGFIDLTDEDQETEERLGIRVVDTAGEADVDLLDYYVSLDASGSAAQGASISTAVGTVSNGTETLAFDLRLQFDWDQEADSETVDLTYAYALDELSIVVEMQGSGGFGAQAYDVVDMDVDISNGQDDVAFNVNVAADNAVVGEILLNGDLVMEISGADEAPVFTRPGGGDLTQAEVNALVTIWNGSAVAIGMADALIAPVLFLLLPG